MTVDAYNAAHPDDRASSQRAYTVHTYRFHADRGDCTSTALAWGRGCGPVTMATNISEAATGERHPAHAPD